MRKLDTRHFRRATRSTPHDINRQIVLNLVREYQPVSRAELARRMRVARGALTSVVRELLEDGELVEGGAPPTERGRRPTLLHVRTRDRLAVAVDVRVARTVVALTDFTGTQLALEVFATPATPAALVDELARRTARLRADGAAGRLGECEGVGLVVPGVVDRRTGRVLVAPQLGWRDVDLVGPLVEQLGLPVYVENASAACALAHVWLAPPDAPGGRLSRTFAYVAVSDGVGVGSVMDGAVLRGGRDTVGEFGHVTLAMDGPRCRCGARGCWEAYVSNTATLARYLDLDPAVVVAPAGTALAGTGPQIEEVIARARGGDGRARWALEETGRYLGVGLANVLHALGPERVVVGGEVAAAWELLEGPLHEAVAERALTPSVRATPVDPEPPGSHPRLRGAVALVASPTFAVPVLG
jgi:predicted NBD/HSP70 family sugar kinase